MTEVRSKDREIGHVKGNVSHVDVKRPLEPILDPKMEPESVQNRFEIGSETTSKGM